MRRKWVHLGFGAVAVAFASLAAFEGARLHEAKHVNAVISGRSGVIANSEMPEARFTQAMALAKRGEYDAALKAYKALGRETSAQLATAALYNAGNLQLRAALKEGPDAAVRALPLIELSKQSYRAALRRDPMSWDARYNLERALWLAPEVEHSPTDRIRRDAEERVMSTLQSTRAELP